MTTNQEQVIAVQAQHVVVALPPTTGLTFAGGLDASTTSKQPPPLHVSQCNPEENPELHYQAHTIVGLYVDSIRLPDLRVTIRQMRSSSELALVLRQTRNLKRDLILSMTPPVFHYPMARLLYVYDIPCHEAAHQHFTLDGFPPQIRALTVESPLNAILHPGLYVISFQVPQIQDFYFKSAGFTGFAVHERMGRTANIPGRSISFAEENPFPVKPRKKNPLFDFGGFFK